MSFVAQAVPAFKGDDGRAPAALRLVPPRVDPTFIATFERHASRLGQELFWEITDPLARIRRAVCRAVNAFEPDREWEDEARRGRIRFRVCQAAMGAVGFTTLWKAEPESVLYIVGQRCEQLDAGTTTRWGLDCGDGTFCDPDTGFFTDAPPETDDDDLYYWLDGGISIPGGRPLRAAEQWRMENEGGALLAFSGPLAGRTQAYKRVISNARILHDVYPIATTPERLIAIPVEAAARDWGIPMQTASFVLKKALADGVLTLAADASRTNHTARRFKFNVHHPHVGDFPSEQKEPPPNIVMALAFQLVSDVFSPDAPAGGRWDPNVWTPTTELEAALRAAEQCHGLPHHDWQRVIVAELRRLGLAEGRRYVEGKRVRGWYSIKPRA